ncbi:MAG: ubiquinone/menaquinone biosynthesis methyltransferase [Deltaproteobacteria bacterium]|nr:ubiquinone/menaquinone biosynthesis methyltransferase [Deltaproteobacteria bacterium]
MTEQIQQLFTSIAPKYDLLNTLLSFGQHKRWRNKGVSYLKNQKKVLDLCAGTLSMTMALLEINPSAEVTAVDFSQEMLDEGLRRHPTLKKGGRGGFSTVCADFFKFDAQPSFFDGMMCAYGMRNLDDNQAALRKIHQLLSPKGRLVILEFFRPDNWVMQLFHSTYAQFVIPPLGRLISRHPHAYEHLRDSVRGFYTIDEYCHLLQENGFEVKVVKRLTGGISGLIVAEKK